MARKKGSDSINVIGHFCLGILVAALLFGLKLYVETLPVGHRIELLTYEFLHGQLPTFSSEIEMPVVVIDINQIPGGKANTITPRNVIRDLLTELVIQRPRAIAVDIDFSPNDNGWIDKRDPEFFEFCLAQKKRAVPILLGVYRTALQRPNTWLGADDFKELAADISIDAKDTSRMRLWVQNGQNQKLLSISAGLINAVGVSLPKPPEWLRFVLQDPEFTHNDQDLLLHSSNLLVNYSKLEVIESQSLPATTATSIKDLGDKFRDKFVILGDATQATDNFIVPGRALPVPGVFLHASAVYSLSVEPFYEFKNWFRIVIDSTLVIAIMLRISIIRWRKRKEDFDWHKAQKRYVWVAVVLSLAVGILAVRLLEVLWLDFFLVIFALLLHPAIEDKVAHLFHIGEVAD